MRHLTFRSAAATLSGKKKEMVAKEEAKYHLAFENEQRARRDMELLETKYSTAKSKVTIIFYKCNMNLILVLGTRAFTTKGSF